MPGLVCWFCCFVWFVAFSVVASFVVWFGTVTTFQDFSACPDASIFSVGSIDAPCWLLYHCPIVVVVRSRGLGQASPSLEAPRLRALETRNLFHQQNRKGKIVMTKTSRYKGLVLGSFLAPEIDMIFGDGVGASLVVENYNLYTQSNLGNFVH